MRPRVALETTLLLHGVPPSSALPLAEELRALVRDGGAEPCLVGVVDGRARTDIDIPTLQSLLALSVPKLNTANLGAAIFRHESGATTVSTTMELAAAAGIRVFATGGLGGVHRNYGVHPDISSDLAALTRFPLAVVTSGVKSILDVSATRELLETLGVPVVGIGTDHFPAFYRRATVPPLPLDARVDDLAFLGRFVRAELARTSRAIVIANPIPTEHELPESDWTAWLTEAERRAASRRISGRAWTPFMLAQVHELSRGRTLEANIALIKHNAKTAALLAAAMA